MVGKNPHRPEGKAHADNERMHASRTKDAPYDTGPSDKARAEQDHERMGAPTRVDAEEQVGGSRPGVPSRVKDAMERREAEDDEE